MSADKEGQETVNDNKPEKLDGKIQNYQKRKKFQQKANATFSSDQIRGYGMSNPGAVLLKLSGDV